MLLWLGTSVPLPAAEPRYEYVMAIGSEGTAPGQFKYVEDFALDSKGRLLVTDAAHAFVQVFDPASGGYITRFGGREYDEGSLEKPEGLSVAPDGRIFVADYLTGEVKVYNAKYEWRLTFSEYGPEPGQNMKSEFTDIYNGKYYMPEAGNHRISVWDLDGNFQFSFGSFGAGNGELNNPESAKFNSRGELFVADMKNNRIQVFDAGGRFLKTLGSEGSEPGQFKLPSGIGIDQDDNIYVGEIGNNRIQVLTREGRSIDMWGTKGNGVGQFENIHGVFVNRTTGWVYVADTGNNRIQVFRPLPPHDPLKER